VQESLTKEAAVDTQVLTQLLGQLRFSATLPLDVLERIGAFAKLRGYSAGTVLFREGSQNDRLLIVCLGRVALDIHVPGRGDIRILSLGPGDMVSWSALLGGGRMTTSAVAVEDTQVVSISAAEVLSLCESNYKFGYLLMQQVAKALADRLVATRLQLLDLFAETPPVIPWVPD
jgi:CRP/FNR family transcriptional regulator, cyclic AMP receptor protein